MNESTPSDPAAQRTTNAPDFIAKNDERDLAEALRDQDPAIWRNLEYLKHELRGRGMAASDGKAQEWVYFLKISCDMKLRDDIPILLDCIGKCAREAGVSVVYCGQAGRFADAANRELREHRRALRLAQEQHEALLAKESAK